MQTAIVTGGTGGLGAAVTGAFLDAGWRVVVPWIVEGEVERVEPRPHLHLM
ncbi:MAG: oxidoreductase, partial [Tepidiformaceae bacterium]